MTQTAFWQKKRMLKRILLENEAELLEKKIAILGGSTTNDIRLMLELFLLNQGIKPSFYESGYNQYYQEAVFDNELLQSFNPDLIYIHTTNRNISSFPDASDCIKSIDIMLENEYAKFVSVWDRLLDTYCCPVIQNNFEMPFYRLMGNKDASDIHGRVNFLTRLNMKFYEYAQTHENFYICDINYISADYGLKEWSDPFYWYMYKYALNVSAIPYLAFNVSNIIKSIFGKNKKGFVMDLDNTLWGGVIGDEGAEGISLGPEEADGQAYLEFQNYIKAHKQYGIILNVNSKNDKENAFAGLKHSASVLHPDDFIEIKANWEPKDKNFTDIAQHLNLLPESLLFIDDNPAERHIVRKQIKGVTAPEVGEVHHFIQNIDRGGYFELTSLSEDDLKRNEMYQKNAERLKQQSAFHDYREYLLSLNMEAVIRPFEPESIMRITQLINKSNQFNLTVRRYTQTEIERIASDQAYIAIYAKLADRFGDNGIVSVVIGQVKQDICHIDLWVMSCRVLKRDMEYAMMDELVRLCSERGIKWIYGYYYPSKKNSMVKNFYALQGFDQSGDNAEGGTSWKFQIPAGYTKKQDVIKIAERED